MSKEKPKAEELVDNLSKISKEWARDFIRQTEISSTLNFYIEKAISIGFIAGYNQKLKEDMEFLKVLDSKEDFSEVKKVIEEGLKKVEPIN